MSSFPTTRWSALVGARSDDSAERQRSWSTLVSAYWKPAYKHVRIRWRKSREDAEDLLQGFFERAMSKDFFAGYDSERARFRTFFRTCLDRYVSNEAKAASRQKRGGGQAALSLDFDAAEGELAHVDREASPEELFDREWKRSVFEIAIADLRVRCDGDKASAFRMFERYDLSDPDDRPTYDALAKDAGVPTTTVTSQLAWVRRELRRIVLEKLGEITATPRELGEEARAVLGAGA